MSKSKNQDVAIASATRELDGVRRAASMAARAMACLEAEAESIAGDVGSSGRALRLVSAPEQFSALIRHGKTVIEIDNAEGTATRHCAKRSRLVRPVPPLAYAAPGAASVRSARQ